uniref:DUF19 domain-containing protein n=1 Tax=Parastrongyloides trichosuri TaxID=131310 RepID=A0A0N4ZRM9_PARTI
MRIILFIFSTLSLVSSFLFDDIFNLPNEVLKKFPVFAIDGNNCNDVAFNHCQYSFNVALNIDTSLTWRNGSNFMYAVEKSIFKNGTAKGFIGACQARKAFYNCLGDMYSSCVNNYYLISKMSNTDDISEAYRYTGFFKTFDFACNGGFEIGIREYNTLSSLDESTTAQNCMKSFDSSVGSQSDQVCKAAGAYATCLQNYFNSQLGLMEGWWVCERTRSGFAETCPQIKCLVTANPTN